MPDIAFPYRLTESGTTARSSGHDHVREMLEQLLFTNRGERINHPDFGCGLLELVFEPSVSSSAVSSQCCGHRCCSGSATWSS